MKNTDKIKEKIKALLSKTIDNGATKEEMESALKKANQLMADFFITEHDIKDNEVIQKCISKTVELTKSGYDLSLFYFSLCELFDVKSYYSTASITFFGYEQDVELCGYFYNVITKTCLLEKDKYCKTEDYKYLRRFDHGKTVAANFIKGFLFEVSNKMEQMFKERESSIPEAYGLMVIEKKEKVKKSFDEMNLNLRNPNKKGIDTSSEAFENGVKKGMELDLVLGLDSCEERNQFALGI